MNLGAGDDGLTLFPNSGRISKASVELCAVGDLDELSATMGVVAAALPQCCAEIQPQLVEVQRALLRIGSFCAGCSEDSFTRVMKEALAGLDRWIAVLDDELPALQCFVLPSGHGAACAAHVARAVCRRAERSFVAMVGARAGEADGEARAVMAYLNRLSSFLFSLARLVNARTPVAPLNSE